jgi:hypothetical protein
MIRRPLSYVLALCLPSVGLACRSEPIDPGTMSQEAADRTADIVRSGALAMKGNQGATSALSDTGNGVGKMVRVFRLSGSDSGSGGTVVVPATPGGAAPGGTQLVSRSSWGQRALQRLGGMAAVVASSTTGDSVTSSGGAAGSGSASSSDVSADLDMAADTLRKLIRNRLLADTNLESKTDDEAIYRLNPDPTCRGLDDDKLDPDCVDTLTKLQVRLRLTRAGDGVEIGLLLAAERVHAVSVLVSSNQLALDVYFGAVKAAILAVAKELGEQPPELPGVMTGTVELSLTKDGPHKVTLASSVLEALEVVNADPKVTIRTAATKPAIALTADGDAGTITARINVAKTEVVVPWQPGQHETGADADIVLGGLTGETTFTQASKTIVLEQLGLGAGPSYLDVRGQRILAAELNPSDGRAFDLSIDFDAQGNPRIAFAPRVDFSLACKLGLVAADFDEAPPSFLLDETYRLQIDPAAGLAPVLAPYQSTNPGDEGGIRVQSGVFSLSSSKVASPVTAAAGQCLVGNEPQPNAHPLLGALEVVTCQ